MHIFMNVCSYRHTLVQNNKHLHRVNNILETYGSAEKFLADLFDTKARIGYEKENVLHIAGQRDQVDAALRHLTEEQVREILEQKNYGSLTPLLFAAQNHSMNSVELLIEAGADVNAVDEDRGYTCAHWAATRGSFAMLECVLEKAPHLAFVKGKDGMTPAHIAAAQKKYKLLQLFSDEAFATVNDSGDLPVHRAASTAYIRSLKVGRIHT